VSGAPIELAADGRLWAGLNGLPGQVAGDVRLAIFVPDGVAAVTAVSTDGRSRAVKVSDNVAFADLADSQAIAFQDAAGPQSVAVPGTPPALVAGG
jgi:hypothetical protein